MEVSSLNHELAEVIVSLCLQSTALSVVDKGIDNIARYLSTPEAR
jgi:hypothetical protein